MADPLSVRKAEYGLVRVFTTDLEPAGNAAITSQNFEKLLGDGVELDPKKVEIFPARMIESIGLPQYLRDGYGVSENALAGKAAVLEALSGLVILVPSSAFRGEAFQLDPNPVIRFVGAFAEEAPEPPVRMAQPETSKGIVTPKDATAGSAGTDARIRSWIIALAALMAAAVIVLLVI